RPSESRRLRRGKTRTGRARSSSEILVDYLKVGFGRASLPRTPDRIHSRARSRQRLDKRNTTVGKSKDQRGSKRDGSERRLTLGSTQSSPRTHTLAAKNTNTRRSVALNLTPSYSRANG